MNKLDVAKARFLAAFSAPAMRAKSQIPYFGLDTEPCKEQPNKGKRSQRRRAAKMRARGFVHTNEGWIHRSKLEVATTEEN